MQKGLWGNYFQGGLKQEDNKSIARLCLSKSKHHFPASGEELCRHKRGKY